MAEFGIWTDEDGGFTETQLYSKEAADTRLVEIIAEIETNSPDEAEGAREYLSVKEVCSVHEDEPADSCEMCMEPFPESE